MKRYVDPAALFAAKREARLRLAKLPIEEKLAMLEKWQKVNPILARIREQGRAEREQAKQKIIKLKTN